MPGSFFDTNVLIYLASPTGLKRERARSIVDLGGTISVQVLNEMATVLRRKLRLDWRETADVLASVRSLLSVVPISVQTHDLGIDMARRYGFAIYDAMIVASALSTDCDILWSEDMHDGLRVEHRLRIANPFTHLAD